MRPILLFLVFGISLYHCHAWPGGGGGSHHVDVHIEHHDKPKDHSSSRSFSGGPSSHTDHPKYVPPEPSVPKDAIKSDGTVIVSKLAGTVKTQFQKSRKKVVHRRKIIFKKLEKLLGVKSETRRKKEVSKNYAQYDNTPEELDAKYRPSLNVPLTKALSDLNIKFDSYATYYYLKAHYEKNYKDFKPDTDTYWEAYFMLVDDGDYKGLRTLYTESEDKVRQSVKAVKALLAKCPRKKVKLKDKKGNHIIVDLERKFHDYVDSNLTAIDVESKKYVNSEQGLKSLGLSPVKKFGLTVRRFYYLEALMKKFKSKNHFGHAGWGHHLPPHPKRLRKPTPH